MSLPAFNPFYAPDVICRTCSKQMERTLRLGPRNVVEAVVYTCTSESCGYTVESEQMLTREAKPIKKAVA
jgi:hypothetical protein